jgi:hypothetical protein
MQPFFSPIDLRELAASFFLLVALPLAQGYPDDFSKVDFGHPVVPESPRVAQDRLDPFLELAYVAPDELQPERIQEQKAGEATAEPRRGRVTLIIRDAVSAQPLPARIHLRDAAGKPVRSTTLPFWRDHFVCDGQAELEIMPGNYQVEIERGPEYSTAAGRFTVRVDERLALTNQIHRIADLASEGWWSGDLHVHRDPAQAELLLAAEDLHIAQFTTWWNRQNAWDSQPLPDQPLRQFPGDRFVHVMAGEDEREGGALLYFNLPKPVDITGATRQYPHSLVFAQQIRRLPGAWIEIEKPFWWDVPVWLAAGVGDSVGLANNHQQRSGMLDNEAWGRPRDRHRFPGPQGNGLWSQELYYQILNAGFRLPPSAGSASGVLPNPVGYNRVYVHVPGELTWARWWDGLRTGRVFVSNGPLLRCRVGGQLPGHVFKSEDGVPIELNLEILLNSRDPVKQIEVISNGAAVRRVPVNLDKSAQRAAKLRVTESGWFLLRAVADVPDTFRFASTGPFYVQIGGKGRRISKAACAFFLEWIRERIPQIKLPDPRQQADVLQVWREAEQFWLSRLAQANVP